MNRNTYLKCCIEYTWSCPQFEHSTFVEIDSDYTGSCKSNDHTITTAPAYYIRSKIDTIELL
jgi:hypothetical protein